MTRTNWLIDTLLLVVVLGLALSLLLTHNEPVLHGLRALALELSARAEARLAWAGHYFRTLEENERLRAENIRLAGELARAREALIANERLTRLLALRDSIYPLPVRAARIIAKDLTRQRNLLTIDAGSTDGVQPGMAVVDDRGIIGTVTLVTPHYARVLSYLNTDFRVAARIQAIGAVGIVRWDGEHPDRLLMEFVSRTEPVRPGMLVVTTPYSNIFPPGFPIGRITEVARQPGLNTLRIYLEPASPLDRASYVFVILHKPDLERQRLHTPNPP
ncbi:rod shape-determining protein MreC [Rhodothermus profundi]|uniref:Cell shape-determining protein MreC n=1 Tax=Rhodothermus profundi TaxID=633813 RepID=A0A1M6PE59_9BACT|nr:rod shape-determining protein MreC [Rhodothermus profundi]SHK06248.1 rod shape-determining protein MreC [Rhodothermus profundi]